MLHAASTKQKAYERAESEAQLNAIEAERTQDFVDAVEFIPIFDTDEDGTQEPMYDEFEEFCLRGFDLA